MTSQTSGTALENQPPFPPNQVQQQPVASAHASLYVGDLDEDITEAMIFEKFNKIGNIMSIRVCRDMISRKGLGYAYVNYSTTAEAEKAIDELNFENMRDRQMRIMWSQRDPSLRKSGVGNLFIKNLDKKIVVRDLYDTFSAIGDILSCKIPIDDKKNAKGYGFVHFVSKEAADTAVQKLNGSILNDKKILVAHFVPKSQRANQGIAGPLFNNLYVKNFGDNMTEEKLTDLFSEYGAITSVCVPMRDNDQSKGFGFVCFKNPNDANKALTALNGSDYEGTTLFVGKAMKKAERLDFLKSIFNKKRAERTSNYASGVNLYVKNLDDNIGDEMLKLEFSKHGNVISAKVMVDAGGRSKGFGFVCFSYPEEATKAVTEMNGKLLGTKPLYVALAQRKEERKAHLQSLMHQRQMAYRVYPNNAAQLPHVGPMMAQNAVNTPFQAASAMNQQHFQNALNPFIMNPTLLNQLASQQFALQQSGYYPGIGNRMMANQPQMRGRNPVRFANVPPYNQAGGASTLLNQSALAQTGGMTGYPTPNNASFRAPMPFQNQMQQPRFQQFNLPGNARMPSATAGNAAARFAANNQTAPAGNQIYFAPTARNIDMQQQVPATGMTRIPNQPVPGMLAGATGAVHAGHAMHSAEADGGPKSLGAGAFQTGQINGGAAPANSTEDFINKVKSASKDEQTQLLGERLYSMISGLNYPSNQVGKLTGMLLEIDSIELMKIIMSEENTSGEASMLRAKVDAAYKVLEGCATGVDSQQAEEPVV